jgi:hypothetical protein
MKLEIKHLAPYLPYRLNVKHTEYIEFGKSVQRTCELSGIFTDCCTFINGSDWYFNTEENDCDIKPILRPMEDIKYYVDFLNTYYVDFDKIEGCLVKRKNENFTRLNELDFLFKNHIDVFGLIEKGLAIDINTLSTQNDG